MRELHPVNLPRIIEDVEQVISSLNYLGGLVDDFSADPPPAIGELLERSGRMKVVALRGCKSDKSRREIESVATSPEEYYRGVFDAEWQNMLVSLKRLGLLLNNGEVDMFDCDYLTRGHLQIIWEVLGVFPGDKPEFRTDGPQERYEDAANRKGPILQMVLDFLKGTAPTYFGNGRVRVQGQTATFTSPSHVQCLNYLVLYGKAMKNDLVNAGVSNPSKTIKELREDHGGLLADYITIPGRSKKGYSTTIMDGRQSIT